MEISWYFFLGQFSIVCVTIWVNCVEKESGIEDVEFLFSRGSRNFIETVLSDLIMASNDPFDHNLGLNFMLVDRAN